MDFPSNSLSFFSRLQKLRVGDLRARAPARKLLHRVRPQRPVRLFKLPRLRRRVQLYSPVPRRLSLGVTRMCPSQRHRPPHGPPLHSGQQLLVKHLHSPHLLRSPRRQLLLRLRSLPARVLLRPQPVHRDQVRRRQLQHPRRMPHRPRLRPGHLPAAVQQGPGLVNQRQKTVQKQLRV